jgi:hypothetical protein
MSSGFFFELRPDVGGESQGDPCPRVDDRPAQVVGIFGEVLGKMTIGYRRQLFLALRRDQVPDAPEALGEGSDLGLREWILDHIPDMERRLLLREKLPR